MRTLLAIPIYNEAKYLQGVLRRVRPHIRDILLVDDGSTDATPEMLRSEPGVFQIRHPVNLGYGQSLIDAFAFARRRGYDWIITMDCDEQHEPEQIPDFLRAAAEDDADVISGSRYLVPTAGDEPPPDRREINRTITRLLNSLLELGITDAFCGFKAYRVKALARLRLTVPGYAMPLQFWVQAARAGLRIRELPVLRIYKDASRVFGGSLDDATVRLRHYLDVLSAELGCDGRVLAPNELTGTVCPGPRC